MAFTGRRLRHHAASVTTRVQFTPQQAGEFAGLLAFMDEDHFLAFGVEGAGGQRTVVARLRDAADQPQAGAPVSRMTIPASGDVELQLAFNGGQARLAWRPAGARNWRNLGGTIDVEGLASVHAGLFTGLVIGPYAASNPAQ
jgi:xylan 1,4-beta-xylosidase